MHSTSGYRWSRPHIWRYNCELPASGSIAFGTTEEYQQQLSRQEALLPPPGLVEYSSANFCVFLRNDTHEETRQIILSYLEATLELPERHGTAFEKIVERVLQSCFAHENGPNWRLSPPPSVPPRLLAVVQNVLLSHCYEVPNEDLEWICDVYIGLCTHLYADNADTLAEKLSRATNAYLYDRALLADGEIPEHVTDFVSTLAFRYLQMQQNIGNKQCIELPPLWADRALERKAAEGHFCRVMEFNLLRRVKGKTERTVVRWMARWHRDLSTGMKSIKRSTIQQFCNEKDRDTLYWTRSTILEPTTGQAMRPLLDFRSLVEFPEENPAQLIGIEELLRQSKLMHQAFHYTWNQFDKDNLRKPEAIDLAFAGECKLFQSLGLPHERVSF